jgi:Na+-driven multidrug efflux pump
MAFTLIAQGICQALGKSLYSLFISILRIVIILLPVLYIFSKFFVLNQIWWAFTIADIVSALICAIFLKHIYTQKVAPLSADKDSNKQKAS